MKEVRPTTQHEPSIARVAKTIIDVDATVQAIIKAMPSTKAWQRQLLSHLADADRNMQVLRMAVALDRPDREIQQAGDQLLIALRAADAFVSRGRADLGTKTAVRIAYSLAQNIRGGLQGAS